MVWLETEVYASAVDVKVESYKRSRERAAVRKEEAPRQMLLGDLGSKESRR